MNAESFLETRFLDIVAAAAEILVASPSFFLLHNLVFFAMNVAL